MWFGKKLARDKLSEAQATYKDMLASSDAVQQQRLAGQCAEALWHVRDWLFTEGMSEASPRWTSKKAFNAWFTAQPEFPVIEHCQDMANGNKHADITRYTPTIDETTASDTPILALGSSVVSPVVVSPARSPGSARYKLADGTVLKALNASGTTREDVEPILRDAGEAWDKVLTRLGK